MLPGKRYTPEEVLWLLWKRKWLLVLPLVVCSAATWWVSRRLPKIYRSETVILLVPQRLSESYVKATVTSKIEDRLNSIREQIFSRTRLEAVVKEFSLYVDQAPGRPIESLIETARSSIQLSVERGDTFRLAFVHTDPEIAQKVTERLASSFITDNLRDREVQAESTSEFLDEQLQEARRRLNEYERKIEAYKVRYAGQLPTQATSNLQATQNAQMQLQSLADSTDRDRERRLLLERQIAELESPSRLPTAVLTTAVQSVPNRPTNTAESLEAEEAKLRELQMRYKPEHPDVVAQKRVIRDLQVKLASETSQARAATAAPAAERPPVISSAEVLRLKRLEELRSDLRSLDTQLARKQEQQRRLETMVAEYQARVDAVPTREAELAELTRDYTTLQNAYTSLLARRQESQVAANLERTQAGEQFKILDPPRVPRRPSSPNLMLINAAGSGFGLALGLALIGLIEYGENRLKTEDDVVRVLELPVLTLVPPMAPGGIGRPRRGLFRRS